MRCNMFMRTFYAICYEKYMPAIDTTKIKPKTIATSFARVTSLFINYHHINNQTIRAKKNPKHYIKSARSLVPLPKITKNIILQEYKTSYSHHNKVVHEKATNKNADKPKYIIHDPPHISAIAHTVSINEIAHIPCLFVKFT